MTLRGDRQASGRDPVRLTIVAALMALFGMPACDDDYELPAPIQVQQEGVGDAPTGLGVVRSSGLNLPEYGLLGDDQEVYIRSFDPQSCAVDTVEDWAGSHEGFAWLLHFRIPAKDLVAGTQLDFHDYSTATTEAVRPGPTGWSSDGYACSGGANWRDVAPTAEIVSVDDSSFTIEVRDLCFVDSGPIEIREIDGQETDFDDPADDVAVDVSGTYEISRCDISI